MHLYLHPNIVQVMQDCVAESQRSPAVTHFSAGDGDPGAGAFGPSGSSGPPLTFAASRCRQFAKLGDHGIDIVLSTFVCGCMKILTRDTVSPLTLGFHRGRPVRIRYTMRAGGDLIQCDPMCRSVKTSRLIGEGTSPGSVSTLSTDSVQRIRRS